MFEAILSSLTDSIVGLTDGPVAGAVENILNDEIPKLLSGIIKDSYVILITDGVKARNMAVALNLEEIVTTDEYLYATTSGGVIPISPDLDVPQALAGTL